MRWDTVERNCDYGQSCRTEEVNLICEHDQKFCAETKEEISMLQDRVTLVFKHASKLKAGQVETFKLFVEDLKLGVRGMSGDFRITPMETRKKYTVDNSGMNNRNHRVIVEGKKKFLFF